MNAHAERLREIADWFEEEDMFSISRQRLIIAADEIERLQAQVEALQKDVGVLQKEQIRLDWLQNSHLWPDFWLNLAGASDIRATIDKAMEKTK